MPIEISDEALYQLYAGGKRKGGKSNSELAELLGESVGQIAGRLHRYNQSRQKNGVQPNENYFVVDIPDPITLTGDWMIVGDVHVPTADYSFAQLPAAVAKKHKIKNLLIAGDLYNMDHFSSYPKYVGTPSWKQEKMAAIQLMSEWVRVFDRIVILMGNHERRLERLLNGSADEEDIFGHLLGSGKVETTRYGWCVIDTPSGKWRATHPRNYSINQLNVADTLAQKYQMHIIGHHEHHLAQGMDRYKHYVIINNGGLFDVDKMAYVIMDDSKSAGMAKGFTMLKKGVATLYGEYPFSDWDEVLK